MGAPVEHWLEVAQRVARRALGVRIRGASAQRALRASRPHVGAVHEPGGSTPSPGPLERQSRQSHRSRSGPKSGVSTSSRGTVRLTPWRPEFGLRPNTQTPLGCLGSSTPLIRRGTPARRRSAHGVLGLRKGLRFHLRSAREWCLGMGGRLHVDLERSHRGLSTFDIVLWSAATERNFTRLFCDAAAGGTRRTRRRCWGRG